jgi:hypothetical protein
MYGSMGPGTPCFDDASPYLIRAVERYDLGAEALETVLAESRARDTLTLWHLLRRAGADHRPRLYDRMAVLAPPPAGVTRESVLNLDTVSLNRWKDELAWIW